MPAYKKVVTYRFEAGGEAWAITDLNDDWMIIEETRKNGQEDCHVSAELQLVGGRWVMDDDARRHVARYMYPSMVGAVETFINEHGLPKEG